MSVLSIRTNEYTPLGAPLVDARHLEGACRCFFDDVLTRATFLEFPLLPAGPLESELLRQLESRARGALILTKFERGYIVRDPMGFDSYFAKTVRKPSRRKRILDREQALREKGGLEFEISTRPESIRPWIETFLNMERDGWKGRRAREQGLAGTPSSFFESMLASAMKTGSAILTSLKLAGNPVAVELLLLVRKHAFSFKIAYDETYKTHAPGITRDLMLLRHAHDSGAIDTVDSCSMYDNIQASELWSSTREITHWIAPARPFAGRYLLALYGVYRKLRGKRNVS